MRAFWSVVAVLFTGFLVSGCGSTEEGVLVEESSSASTAEVFNPDAEAEGVDDPSTTATTGEIQAPETFAVGDTVQLGVRTEWGCVHLFPLTDGARRGDALLDTRRGLRVSATVLKAVGVGPGGHRDAVLLFVARKEPALVVVGPERS